jgi:NAD(P)-dependent dehydrogenase (short-subunit alcohol dehydrogenase family)
MTGRLQGKAAIVTGAGSGNGRGIAASFAREGARVLVSDIREAAAAQTAVMIRENGGICEVVQADVSRRTDITRMVDACVSAFGTVHVLVNNVGILVPGGVEEVEEEAWDRVFAANLKSVLFACRAALPYMTSQGAGSIINISSISAIRHLGLNYIAYPTSKAAIDHMTRIMAVQYGPKGVRCNSIQPGFIDTPMVKDQVVGALGASKGEEETAYRAYMEKRASQVPMRRVGAPQDIGNAAVFLASDEASYITGQVLTVDGGVTQSIGN